MSASVKVILFKSKVLKNGEHPIMLRVTKDRKSKYLSVGANCSPEFWDEKNNCPKKKHPTFDEINMLIDVKKIEAQKLLLDLKKDGRDFSAEELQRKMKGTVTRKTGVLAYFLETIEKLEKSNRIGYANVFRFTMNSLKRFRDEKEFAFSDVTLNFLNRYEEFCTAGGAQLNSVFVYMRTFKTLLNNAKKDDLVQPDYNPFKDYPFTKFRKIKTRKRAITVDDIEKIIAKEVEEGSTMAHAKAYFLFSYYCRGINFSDIAFLKWSNIQNGRLKYARKKTKEEFNIKLPEQALEIIEHFKEEHYQGKEGYIFPILFDRHKTPVSIENRIDKMLKVVNKGLKELGNACGIEVPLTTYVARHSFATNLKRSGAPIAFISEALGHDSEKTTKIYLDSFENDALDNVVGVLFSKHQTVKENISKGSGQ